MLTMALGALFPVAFASAKTGSTDAHAAQAQDPPASTTPAATDPSAPVPAAATPTTGGAEFGVEAPPVVPVQPVVEGFQAQLLADGTAAAPSMAPPEVQQAIWAANEIVGKPYVYGGGHRSFRAKGYDCSGTVSYALHGGGLIDTPLDSSDFMKWGVSGTGLWITVFSNPGHAYTVIAGLRLDTSAASDPSGAKGPRWRPNNRSSKGYKKRHLLNF